MQCFKLFLHFAITVSVLTPAFVYDVPPDQHRVWLCCNNNNSNFLYLALVCKFIATVTIVNGILNCFVFGNVLLSCNEPVWNAIEDLRVGMCIFIQIPLILYV